MPLFLHDAPAAEGAPFEPLAQMLRGSTPPAAHASLPARIPAARVAPLPEETPVLPAPGRVLRRGTFRESEAEVAIGVTVAREHEGAPSLPWAEGLPGVEHGSMSRGVARASRGSTEEDARSSAAAPGDAPESSGSEQAEAPEAAPEAALEAAPEAAREAALEAARAEGYAAGRADAEAALRAEVELHKAAVSTDLERLEERLRAFLTRLETDLVAVALDAAELVAGATPPEPVAAALGRAVAQALDALSTGDALGVHLHPVDLLRLQEEGIVDALSASHPGLRWAPDDRLAEGDWYVFSHEAAVRRVRAELLDGLRARFDLLEAAAALPAAPPPPPLVAPPEYADRAPEADPEAAEPMGRLPREHGGSTRHG